ncbi:hypothetical protein AWB76_00528 [Caballeronia temeraria]|uniref:Uncharacterized protein n=1 Tax=Caballeronia temeraria TaxID=1777137 RepID=A0A157ZDQ1_9BURK|nr:hypothetical protein [Caballeronia temeraria]SAK43665.1 hypothetical protein AWB76_00528 [Caballeronia temeraria]
MSEVIEVTAWHCLSTISVRYEGKEAASHEIDLNQLGQSIQGLARIFALCSNVLLTGELNTRLETLDVRVVCAPVVEHRCFEVLAMVKSVATSKELWSGAFGAALAVVVQYVLSRREQDQMKYVNEGLKHFHDALQLALRNNQASTESVMNVTGKLVSLIEKLTDVLRPDVRHALSPIDRSCSRIDLYTEGHRLMTLSADHKHAFAGPDAIKSETPVPYVGVISEFDMATGACKITLDGEVSRIPAIVIDSAFNRPNNRYVRAMASADSIRFLAEADLDSGGNPVRLYISSSSEHDSERAAQ